MKISRKCIKCGCEAIWKIDPLSIHDVHSSNVVIPVPVGVREIENADAGLLERPLKRTEVGTFEVFVCAHCGYSELWAKDIEELGKLRKGPEDGRGTKVMRLKKREG